MSPYLPIRNLLRAILGRGPYRRHLIVLSAYFDDSGTHAGSAAVVMGGLIGNEIQWEFFERAWAKLLAHPLPDKPPLKQFHLSHCQAHDGEFESYNRAESDHVTYLFRQIIVHSNLFSITVAIDREAFEDTFSPNTGVPKDAIKMLCFTTCVEEASKSAQIVLPEDRLAIVFDQELDRDIYVNARKAAAKEACDNISSIAFSKVSEVLPLQGADMIATESYWYACDWLRDRTGSKPRQHFQRLLDRERGQGFMMRREDLFQSAVSWRERFGSRPLLDPAPPP